MKKEFALALTLFAFILVAVLVLAASQNRLQPAQQLNENTACTVAMTEIIASGQGDVYNMEGAEVYEDPDFAYLVIYSVEGNEITDPSFESVPVDWLDEQKNSALQAEAWQLFADVIPAQNRDMIAKYRVFTDGADNTLAAVEQNPEDITQWILDVDMADIENKDLLLSTLVHEYAHVLTLSASQVIPDQEVVDNWNDYALLQKKAVACPDYFTDTGCSYSNSYINAFYNRFWLDIADEWAKISAMQHESKDLVPYYNALYQFYLSHSDEFVDDYATTHPTEDIAESFTYFVFSPKPTGDSIKEQKIRFFYEYPELVELRASILDGACSMEQ